MKVSASSKAILGAVNTVGSLIRPTTVPIYENLLVEISEDSVCFTADNMEVRSSASIKADTEGFGEICIPYDVFSRILKGLPDVPIVLLFDKFNLKIIYPTGEYEITTVSPVEFQKPNLDELENSIKLDSASLLKGIEKGILFVDDSREDIIKNVLIRIGEKKSCVIGMSPYGGFEVDLNCSGIDSDILLSKSSAVFLKNGIVSDDELTLSWSDKKLNVKSEDMDMTFVLQNGKYIDYQKAFPEPSKNKFTTSQSDILPALKRASLISDKDHRRTNLNFSGDKLEISHANSNFKRNFKESMAVDYSGDDISIGFNTNFLRMVFSNISTEDSETASMYFTSPGKQCLIEGDGFRGILCPIFDN